MPRPSSKLTGQPRVRWRRTDGWVSIVTSSYSVARRLRGWYQLKIRSDSSPAGAVAASTFLIGGAPAPLAAASCGGGAASAEVVNLSMKIRCSSSLRPSISIDSAASTIGGGPHMYTSGAANSASAPRNASTAS